MKLILVRHAQSEYNRKHLCNADPHKAIPLTAKGRQQARAVQQRAKKYDFNAVYTSRLLRAQQTAQIITGLAPERINVDERLDEFDSGFEGQHILKLWWAFKRARDPLNARFNQGESQSDVYRRTYKFLTDVKSHEPSKATVLIVGHELPLQALLRIIDGLPEVNISRPVIKNGQVVERTV
jgi:broad specificity phosphatase PhoE